LAQLDAWMILMAASKKFLVLFLYSSLEIDFKKPGVYASGFFLPEIEGARFFML